MRFFEITTNMDEESFSKMFMPHAARGKKKSEPIDKIFPEDDEDRAEKIFSSEMINLASDFWEKSERKAFVCLITRRDKTRLILGVVLQKQKDAPTFPRGASDKSRPGSLGFKTAAKLAEDFLAAAGIVHTALKTEETTLHNMAKMITAAYRNDYVKDDDEVYEMIGIDKLLEHRSVEFTEVLRLPRDEDFPSKEDLCREAGEIFCGASLRPEIERIFQGPRRKVTIGHPVHYIISSDSEDARRKMLDVLFKALRANGRVRNGRYSIVSCDTDDRRSDQDYTPLWRVNSGGMVVINYIKKTEGGDNYARPGVTDIADMCRAAREFKNDVLTVLCLPRESAALRDLFLERLDGMAFLPIKEEPISGDTARQYLRAAARNAGISPDKSLYAIIKDPEREHMSGDLDHEFDNWFNNVLRKNVYPQYSEMPTGAYAEAIKKPKGGAYRELEEMIGLAEVKAVIKKAVNYYKAQAIFGDRGMAADSAAMHMIFTGSPGTAKTSVARIFARIMKENGLLSAGHLIEVGRADLVGQYVGWTAPTVKRKFREARGSVLFIDEAYSLVDDREGLYGDEAINTIVQEMENHRRDIIVIFAGYTDKMDKFLLTNPGLRSRVAFHVPFADYTSCELYDILEYMARQGGKILAPDVRDRVMPILRTAASGKNFGNGRFVRNLFERAKMNQADRLISAPDTSAVTASDVKTLLSSDFEPPTVKQSARAIGF